MKVGKPKQLTIEDVLQVARSKEPVELEAGSNDLINQSHKIVEDIVQSGNPVYGINTGFGSFADHRINRLDINKLNRNLIISHAVGTGDPFEEEIVRAAILIRAHTLAQGYSGVRVKLIETLLDVLNKQLTPVIPSQGSLGSSGDLCQLAHLALVITKDDLDLDDESGKAHFEGQLYSGKTAMSRAGIERIKLGPKEGLAITNGATFSAAISSLVIEDALHLWRIANIATSLTMEALCASSTSLDERIHEIRGQEGQKSAASKIKSLLEGSQFIDSLNIIQDAYSIRCAPQVHGAIMDVLGFVKNVVERELNAVTDNPLIFSPGVALSGGNFHGEPLALAMDMASIALSELGAISERRTFRMTSGDLNRGLPAMLVDNMRDAGLNSGLMLPHYTAASLVLENQTLATPDSIRSLPTSANQEDHNANALTAARHAYQIVENLRQILSIELYTATRAISIRRCERMVELGAGTGRIYEIIRNSIPYQPGDALWAPEIEEVNNMVKNRRF